jgi:hypothetical protein
VKRGKLARYRQTEDKVNRKTPIEKLNGVGLDDVTSQILCQMGVRTYENLRFEDNFYQIPGLINRGRGRVTQKKFFTLTRELSLQSFAVHTYSLTHFLVSLHIHKPSNLSVIENCEFLAKTSSLRVYHTNHLPFVQTGFAALNHR